MNKDFDSQKSLSEVHSSINVPHRRGWKKMIAFLGPAYLISVGYMDPGNWATDIAGGSQFGYTLIWVLLMSNMMALVLQSLSARLGIVRQLDLAQASRNSYPTIVNIPLWIYAEIAIAACDLAEILGMAIGLQLLFGIPLIWGVTLTVLDTLLLLMLQSYGMRKIEAIIISLVAVIGVSFFLEMLWAKPDVGQMILGFIPSIPNNDALYISIGIIGATVMPHNLYLHSSLVQTRQFGKNPKDIKTAIRFNVLDSTIALNVAFCVNAAILILAASTFYYAGMFDVSSIQDAYNFLTPLLGTHMASIFFGVALIAASQSSTITGTLAGQVVMEGYLNLRIEPWIRRLITRLVAIVPACVVIIIYGESSTDELLIFSQVVLSLQLGFAVLPLIHFTSDKKKMGEFAIKPWLKIAAWVIAIIIIGLNAKLVFDEYNVWLALAGDQQWMIWTFVFPIILISITLLFYVGANPIIVSKLESRKKRMHSPAETLELDLKQYSRIAISLDFSDADVKAIESAVSLGGHEATYLIIHVVETAGAIWYGRNIADRESEQDKEGLQHYKKQLTDKGYNVETKIGYGSARHVIPKIVTKFDSDLLVMGAHGHNLVKDLIFGETVNAVRHKIKIPVFVVRMG